VVFKIPLSIKKLFSVFNSRAIELESQENQPFKER
jgi:hypothetical protein